MASPEIDTILDTMTAGQLSERRADQAYRRLEELIVTLQLSPGSIWSEVALSDRVGIGRTPVREAVQRLAEDHLVIIRRRHGIMISEVNAHQQLLVLEARQQLERLLAGRAARRANPQERAVMTKVAEAMETPDAQRDIIVFLRQYFDAKKFMSKCARNPFAEKAIMPLYTLSRRFYFIYHEELNNLPDVTQLHANIMRAVASGDEGAAAAASDQHIEFARDFTKRILTERF